MTIPSEDLFAYQIDKQIEEYFRLTSYDVHLLDKPTRRKENSLGFDSIFQKDGTIKVFALQYKRPEQTSKNGSFTFSIKDNKQSQIMAANASWMYYALPLSIDRNKLPGILYHTMFLNPTEISTLNKAGLLNSGIKISTNLALTNPQQLSARVVQWGEFVDEFLACHIGMKVKKAKDLLIAHRETIDVDNFTTYVVNLDSKEVFIVKENLLLKNDNKLSLE